MPPERHVSEPQIKKLKFEPALAEMIRRGEKFTTWRFFDDKNLQVGDIIDCIDKANPAEPFARVRVTQASEKPFGKLTPEDWDGHEKFMSEYERYETYSSYYNIPITPDTMVKVLRFERL